VKEDGGREEKETRREGGKGENSIWQRKPFSTLLRYVKLR
jgi:hypothetical protein